MVERSTTKANKWQAFVQMMIVVAIAIALNVIAAFYYDRIDLTEDNRFTIGEPTERLLDSLNDVVFVKVYLEGEDLPPGFRKLSQATRDLLEEFRNLAGDKVQYQFINVEDAPDAKTKQDLIEQLSKQGLNPVNLQVRGDDEVSQKIIFPGAIVTYANKSIPVTLLQQQLGNISPEEVLNNSIIGLEYQFSNAIRKLSTIDRPKIAFIRGHGELEPEYVEDAVKSLDQYYQVDFVDLPRYKVGRLDPYAAVIIAKPDSTFTELEKYKIDQFIMRGGKAMFLIDALAAELDSFRTQQANEFFTWDFKLNLEDMLFKYGVRVNPVLVQDLNSNYIPMVSPYGTQQQRDLLKWPYFPVAVPQSEHPIVNNLNAVWFSFANTIDTLDSRSTQNVKKTVLLQSSPYTRVMPNPVRVATQLAFTHQREAQLFNNGPQNLAVLLEGTFTSLFKNRLAASTIESGEYGELKESSEPTKIIVVADGDVIKNQVVKSTGEIMPLGYDPFTRQSFGNKDFVLNAVDYLIDEGGLITLRAKDYRLRLLNEGRVKSERLQWQLFNMVIPVIAIFLFGLIYNYTRRRRFATKE